ncbi:Hypothetical_protein [Hexamita inflata]|uniref:Hypothetical_protein n=1 Tax=Hexamita inflata TaxID=28002 RepID=A0AA86TJJ5_9EUKA|nr:Hypothetical protein HINF_LOCUS8294 [Hexamita inflata]
MLQVPKVLRQINNESTQRTNHSTKLLSFQSSSERLRQNLSTDFCSIEDYNKKYKLMKNISETVEVLKTIESKIQHLESCSATIETNFEAMQRNVVKIKRYVIKLNNKQ